MERALLAIRINPIARGGLMISDFSFSFPPLLFSSLASFRFPFPCSFQPRGERALGLQVRTFEPIQERSRVLRPVNPLSVSPLLPLNPQSADNRARRSKARHLPVQLRHFSLARVCPLFFTRSHSASNVSNRYSLTRGIYNHPEHSQSCPTAIQT